MSFSYDPTLTGPTDTLRFLLRDTVEADAVFSDEELTAMLALNDGKVQQARLECLITLLADSSRFLKWTQAQNSVDKGSALDALKLMITEVKALITSDGDEGGVVDFSGQEIDYYGVRIDPRNSV